MSISPRASHTALLATLQLLSVTAQPPHGGGTRQDVHRGPPLRDPSLSRVEVEIPKQKGPRLAITTSTVTQLRCYSGINT